MIVIYLPLSVVLFFLLSGTLRRLVFWWLVSFRPYCVPGPFCSASGCRPGCRRVFLFRLCRWLP